MRENTRSARRRAPSGFTLVELMVVISIIAILATIVGYNVFNQIDESGVAAAQAQIKNFKTAIVAYKLKHRKLPASLDDLVTEKLLDAPKVPVDPWGNAYQYRADGRDFEIISYGADGRPGGTGVEADISSSNLAGDRN